MRLRDLREDNDYTQKQIANILNCKQNTYQQYEAEKRQIPIEALKKLATLYETSIDYIVEFTNIREPYSRININNSFNNNINTNISIGKDK